MVVYGYTPNYPEIGKKPILLKRTVDYIGVDGRCWIVERYIKRKPSFFWPWEYDKDKKKAQEKLDGYWAKIMEDRELDDDVWAEKDTRRILLNRFDDETAERYMIALRKLNQGNFWDTKLLFVDGTVYYKVEPFVSTVKSANEKYEGKFNKKKYCEYVKEKNKARFEEK